MSPLEILQYDFARDALTAGLLIALLGAVVGFFVVLRRMAFVAAGISHAALGGVAIGVLLHQSPTLWAIIFSIAVALMMARLGQRGVHEDTAMGIFFPASMAFGVVAISFSKTWQQDLLGYLFGNILAVNRDDLVILAVTTAGVLGVTAIFFKELLFVSFDEESAHAAGVPVDRMRTLLLVLCAVTVVVSIKVVGTVLVSAMLVIPAATAALWTGRWQRLLAGSAVIGLAAMGAGWTVSFSTNVAMGPAVVLVAAGIFAVSAVASKALSRRRTAAPLAEPTLPASESYGPSAVEPQAKAE